MDWLTADGWGESLFTVMHRTDGKIDRLAKLELFEGCTRKALTAAARLVDFVHVEPGRVLARQGEPARQILMVSCGKVLIQRDGRDAGAAGKGARFGEIAALGNLPYSETVTAQGYAEVAVIGARDLVHLLESVPCLALKVLQRAIKQPEGVSQ